ncbi:MAG: hypothetical protein ABI367_02575 [Mucilaginibacter sp.]
MTNTFFISSYEKIIIERFHICSWEFNTNVTLLEFGCEINKTSIEKKDKLNLSLYIPWLTKDTIVIDLYKQLSSTENSRFIFNDSVNGTDMLDGGVNKAGIIHRFKDRAALCILPVNFNVQSNQLDIDVDLKPYNTSEKPNIYFRFCIKLKGKHISTRKLGINKSTIIYDVKVNEKRNIPVSQSEAFRDKEICHIETCFCFNILPNRYDIVFPDSSLKNVRTLEHSSFNQYLGEIIDIPKDELMVVFNKKSENFNFFSIYTQERIGPAQFAAAILINVICGILLFIPSYRKSYSPEMKLSEVWYNFPLEIYISFTIAILSVAYFLWPKIIFYLKKISFGKK